MALKFKLATGEAPSEAHKALYVERGGALVLDVEGAVEGAEHERINDALTATKAELAAAAARAKQLEDDLQATKVKSATGLEGIEGKKFLDNLYATARQEGEKALQTVTAERDSLVGQLTAIQINQAVAGEAMKRGLRPKAMPDLMARATGCIKLLSGQPVVMEADGRTPKVGKSGASMSLSEWVEGQVAEAPHLFAENNGSGATGSGNGGALPGKNPWRKETWNVTEQMRVLRTDPGLAARLKAAA